MSGQPPLSPLEPWIAAKIGRPAPPLARAELEAYQLGRLNATLTWARTRSLFYRTLLSAVPRELASLSDLAALPFTTAEDIRQAGLRFLCVSQDDIQRVVTLDTSGTTGRPKRIYFTADDQELTVDFFRVGMSTFTDPGDTVLILLPGDRPGSVGALLATALAGLGARPVKHGLVTDVRETLEVMQREHVDCLVGVPTQVLALATYGAGLRLKSALLTTDHVPQAIVRRVEAAWGCTVYNHYGMTEMGLGGGVECQARHGYHVREADLLFEVVDPHTGAPLPDGEQGEVVFTTLTRRGMPLVRYRTGDVGRFVPGACPCSTTLKTLACVTHRLEGEIAIGDDVLTMADLDEALFALPGVLDFAAAVDCAPAAILTLVVNRVESGAAAEETEVQETLRRTLGAGNGDLTPLEVRVRVTRSGYALAGPPKRSIALGTVA